MLGGYGVEVFDGPLPEGRIDDFCTQLAAFVGEVPTGDLDLGEQQWTPDRVRDHDKRAEPPGRVQVVTVAVAPEGHLCRFSDLRINSQDPRHAFVGETLVLPEHRGHRLGLAMKLATHRHVKSLLPGCSYVETGNPGVNTATGTVNTQLGYQVVERCLDAQERL